MTILSLHKAVCERMEAIAETFWQLDTRLSSGKPNVYPFALPDRQPNKDYFPYIIVRLPSGSDNNTGRVEDGEDSRANIDLELGIYADDAEGQADLALLIESIRYSLQADPVVDDRFECIPQMDWQIADPETRPYWFATMSTVWRIPQPQRVAANDPGSNLLKWVYDDGDEMEWVFDEEPI